jgi:hypothetical protein
MADNPRIVISTDEETLASALGEGIHTAFRKAIDNPQAMRIHRLINEMPDGDWSQLIDWLIDSFKFMDLAKTVNGKGGQDG